MDPRDEVVGSKGVVKKVELVRMILEVLDTFGYREVCQRLEQDSGIPLHSDAIKSFLEHIRNGQWTESLEVLGVIAPDDHTVKMASFEILLQKFIEFVKEENIGEALRTLQKEVTPLQIHRDQPFRDPSLDPGLILVNADPEQPLRSREELIETLRNYHFQTEMVPKRRLVGLVEKVADWKKDACKFHNSVREVSLLTDHKCHVSEIPSETIQILEGHDDEVWFLQFSHNGRYLASSSKDLSVVIWELRGSGRFDRACSLRAHRKPVPFMSWSPNDKFLITCGSGEVIRLWDTKSWLYFATCELKNIGMLSCGMAGENIFSISEDKRIGMWNLDGVQLIPSIYDATTKTPDMVIAADGEEIIFTFQKKEILLYKWRSKLMRFIEEQKSVTSLALSQDNHYLLVSLLDGDLHLWKIDYAEPKLVMQYTGRILSRFVVRACFGGWDEGFIASGSEDRKVYIWHRASGEIVFTLDGHALVVNCVSWNPVNFRMLASASDDRTVRIWGNIDLVMAGNN